MNSRDLHIFAASGPREMSRGSAIELRANTLYRSRDHLARTQTRKASSVSSRNQFVTVKVKPLLGQPTTVTIKGPVVAPPGTDVVICVALQLVGKASAPLKVTVLVPWLEPNVVPVIVTTAPTGPCAGETLMIDGITVNVPALAHFPVTQTFTGPVVAPPGTGTLISVLLHAVGTATDPLKRTVLVPCDAPKPLPTMLTDVPTGPSLGIMPLIAIRRPEPSALSWAIAGRYVAESTNPNKSATKALERYLVSMNITFLLNNVEQVTRENLKGQHSSLSRMEPRPDVITPPLLTLNNAYLLVK
jgi:hypothetical protein